MDKQAVSPFSWGCPERLAALRDVDLVGTQPEATFDEITQLARDFCGTPIAILSFLCLIANGSNPSSVWRQIHFRWMRPSAPRRSTNRKLSSSRIWQSIQIWRTHPWVAKKPFLRFYASARLETPEGNLLGSIMVCDREPREDGLTHAQSGALLALARAVMRELELRRSSKAAAQHTASLSATLEHVHQGILMVDKGGDVVVCNSRAIDLLGLPPEMMRSTPKFEDVKRWQIEQGEFAGSDPALVQAIRHEGNNIEASVYERHRPNGTILEVRTNRLPNGGVVRTFTDVTAARTAEDDRKLAQERLRESEQRYRLAAHATSDAIYDWDLATDRLHWGDRLLGIFGYGSSQAPASGETWLDSVHPEDRAAIEAEMAAFVAGQTGERWQGEYRWLTGDGSYAYVRDRGYLVRGHSGHPLRMVGALQDLTQARGASEALRSSEERLRLALAATGLGIWDLDFASGHRDWSSEVRRIVGLPEGAPLERELFLLHVHPDDQAKVDAAFFRGCEATIPDVSTTFRVIKADTGETRWVEIGGRALYDSEQRAVRMLGTFQDITPRKIAEDTVRLGEERLRLALHASNMVAWDLDLVTSHVDRSDNAFAVLGLGSGPSRDFLDRVHGDDQQHIHALRVAAIAQGTHSAEVRYTTPDGREMWLALRAERKDDDRLIGITFDISDRKATEEALWQSAHRDALTGLPNRALFSLRLEDALSRAEVCGEAVGLLLLDLDDFKDINDTLGHAAGDQLLVETAARLTRLIGRQGTVARVGGDEFAVVLVGQSGLAEIAACADAIAEALRSTFDYQGRAVSTQASIGVAAFPEHHRDPTELMKDADIALYRAKESGRSRAIAYTSAARDLMERRVSILREVRQGLAASEFVPYYQPKVSLTTGSIVGFEALARWRHPTRGLLTPAYFGTAFGDQELSAAMARTIIARVASDMRGWLEQNLEIGRVAVNLSSADFADKTLASGVIALLTDAGVPPSQFEIEVTETVLLDRETEDSHAILGAFHKAGISIALDDFGTGFASLTHLKQFPVDHIKIDQSFIRNLETDKNDAAIVAAVISLGRSMGMTITAEGVENTGQENCLREAGCDWAQGYLFAKPSSGERVPWLIRNWSTPRPQTNPRRRRQATHRF